MAEQPVRPSKKTVSNCLHCDKEFSYYYSMYKTANNGKPKMFCSRACHAASKAHRRATTICPQCGKEFEYHLSWPRKYCSNVCAGKANIGNIKKFEPTGFEANCEQCGQPFWVKPAQTRGRFCSLACFGAWQVATGWQAGEKHPNWTGGYEPYYGASWESARRAVLQRDVICQDCGMTQEEAGKELDVHHIKPFRTFGRTRHLEANALSNLIALCNRCHTTREYADRRAAQDIPN